MSEESADTLTVAQFVRAAAKVSTEMRKQGLHRSFLYVDAVWWLDRMIKIIERGEENGE